MTMHKNLDATRCTDVFQHRSSDDNSSKTLPFIKAVQRIVIRVLIRFRGVRLCEVGDANRNVNMSDETISERNRGSH